MTLRRSGVAWLCGLALSGPLTGIAWAEAPDQTLMGAPVLLGQVRGQAQAEGDALPEDQEHAQAPALNLADQIEALANDQKGDTSAARGALDGGRRVLAQGWVGSDKHGERRDRRRELAFRFARACILAEAW